MFDKIRGRFRQAGKAQDVVPPGTTPSLNDAYRLIRDEDRQRYTELALEAFPHLATRIQCFGADWLGRQFATDEGRLVDGQPQVLLLEPGSGEIYEIPDSFDSFHEREILEHPNETVELGLLSDWIETGGALPSYRECIGYKEPLFLGGSHDFTNFELSDIEVYWTICSQILARIRDLPEGTRINRITIE